MEYMESKMQDFIEAGQLELDQLLEEFNPPSDWDNPKWYEYEKVHCWRNYISDAMIKEWPNLTGRQKIKLSKCFEDIANQETWE